MSILFMDGSIILQMKALILLFLTWDTTYGWVSTTKASIHNPKKRLILKKIIMSVFLGRDGAGTRIAFIKLNSDSVFHSKIAAMVALAPVAYLANVKNPLRLMSPLCKSFDFINNLFGSCLEDSCLEDSCHYSHSYTFSAS
ncbi:unnamed protein product [Schistocephalus solidus]|uniref:Secreted protein n=1 Tax=Schistocephalus solidus TaxID=70667 RepID=A0A183TAW4_SCHSO|nr:unnamed protein product [Schistocephalus solidus]